LSKIIITLPENKDAHKKPWKCELCEKKKMSVDIYCGGPFFKLCPECAKIADKAIDGWVRMVYHGELGHFINTVQDIIKDIESAQKENNVQ